MSIQDALAANVRKLRKEAGYSQESFAEKCGMHRTYIGGIEQGRANVTINNAQRIADALGVSPIVLFAEKPEDIPAKPRKFSWSEAQEMVEHALLDTGEMEADAGAGNGAGSPTGVAEGSTGPQRSAPAMRSADDATTRYAFCVICDDHVQIEDLDVVDPDMALQILSSLVYNHCPQDKVALEFHRIQSELIEYIAKRAKKRTC